MTSCSFSRGDLSSVSAMVDSLGSFAKVSGFYENLDKTNVFFGDVSGAVKKRILDVTSFSEGCLPITYLGVPLSSSRLKIRQYLPFFNKLGKHTNHWTSSFLSHAGKLQLINSILFSNLVYWCSVFLLPQGVVKRIEACARGFYWGMSDGVSNKHWIKWDFFSRSKLEGGVGDTIWSVSPKPMDHWLWKDLLVLRDELVARIGSAAASALLLKSAGRGYNGSAVYDTFRTMGP
ncbi:hypothetical protein RND81_03G039600 [Saponaria officinalis]|uniref:Uncharacterized protein n=1 Tax=Saponaria officinalis TaxID=3572 RepID=A0AAW1LYK1_SAPOF